MSVDDPPDGPSRRGPRLTCTGPNVSSLEPPLEQPPHVRDPPSVPLHVEIERTKQQTRIAALERELTAARRSKRAVIEQYERILEMRACDCTGTAPSTGILQTLRRRL